MKSLAATGIATTIAGCGGGPEGTETEGGGATATETEAGTTEGGATATETEAGTGTEEGTGTGTEESTGTDGDVDINLGFEDQRQIPAGIQVSNTNLQQTDNGVRVTGTIENTGDQTYEELEVQVTLLDDTDDILGEFFDNTEESEFEAPFEPGESWEFAVDLPRADLGQAARYRIDVDADIDQGVDFGAGTGTATGTSS